MEVENAPNGSVSVSVGPQDRRCRYWAKVVRAEQDLPLPSEVSGAGNIESPYLQRGDEELLPGDVLFEGEANHHSKDRGWSYLVQFVDSAGACVMYRSGFSAQKAAAKAQGMATALLAGSGDVAGAVRVAHALRAGLNLPGAV